MRRARGSSIHVFGALAGILAACGDGTGSGYALHARGGTYVDGTGRLGTAVLATLRDASGAGPTVEWSGSLVAPDGTRTAVTYVPSSPSSWTGAWWPEMPPYAGAYSLELAPNADAAVAASFLLAEGTGLAPAEPQASDDGTAIAWGPIDGAVAYECRVFDDGAEVARRVGNAPSCDIGALAPGAYVASVLAYSVDVGALGESGQRSPALPDRFDVSEARLAFVRAGGEVALPVVRAAGGGFSNETTWTGAGLAVWVSITNPDGTPTAVPWSVEVVGPGLTASAPLTFTYPANFPRLMVWTGGVEAASGSYGLVARSGGLRVAGAFRIGAIGAIGAPTGVTAEAGAQGSASVSWSVVPGARSYLVTARRHATQAFVMNQWVSGTAASFPAGTFPAGDSYYVTVAATDVDMVGGTPPTQVAITENGFQPASFVAR